MIEYFNPEKHQLIFSIEQKQESPEWRLKDQITRF